MSYQCLSNLKREAALTSHLQSFETELLDAGGLSLSQTATVDGRDRSVVVGALQEKHQTSKRARAGLLWKRKGRKICPNSPPYLMRWTSPSTTLAMRSGW